MSFRLFEVVKFTIEISEKIDIIECEFAGYPAFFKEPALVKRYFSNRRLNFEARIPGSTCRVVETSVARTAMANATLPKTEPISHCELNFPDWRPLLTISTTFYM